MKKGTPQIAERTVTERKTATQVLVEHHDVLRDLVRRLAKTPRTDPARRRALTDELYREVQMHERIEEDVYYPAVEHVTTTIPHAWSEHRQMTDQLAALLRTDPETGRFDDEVRIMRDVLESHAHLDEERSMFPEVERYLDEERLVELGERLQRRLAELRASKALRARHRFEITALRGVPHRPAAW